jgi:hypothetical protein
MPDDFNIGLHSQRLLPLVCCTQHLLIVGSLGGSTPTSAPLRLVGFFCQASVYVVLALMVLYNPDHLALKRFSLDECQKICNSAPLLHTLFMFSHP